MRPAAAAAAAASAGGTLMMDPFILGWTPTVQQATRRLRSALAGR